MSEPFAFPSRAQLRALHRQRMLVWYDYADLWLSGDLGRTLDYGCGTGGFLSRIASRCTSQCGVDIDPVELETARRRNPTARIEHVLPGTTLPFADESFDTVILMEVIEHVADERAVLRDIARVLAPGGRLLLTTPHRGLLTFLDPGNFKFILPSVHRFVQRVLLRREAYYESRFGAARQAQGGMIGDFSTDQEPWHRHYPYAAIRRLAPRSLETVAHGVYFPAFRALQCANLVCRVVSRGRLPDWPTPLLRAAQGLSRRQMLSGDQLVVLMRKV